ncbi:phage tail assembly chaperone [Pseudovibrio sp. Ad37]|uniref:phage tail assembly chaperone n=1 Tax=Pseudovibrio sp. Ad37 TaxID=989422 RepID=UPI0007AEE10A|nr:phage tail assembly chaperone [Pseudovibrio sp. Ad37]
MKPGQSENQAVPWHDLMHKACRELGWSPHTFWHSTLVELEMAFTLPGTRSARTITRGVLEDLLAQFPDKEDQQTP